jgi:predicted acylesterase/phospholipase RssA/CRP-like cAMP-binding protein
MDAFNQMLKKHLENLFPDLDQPTLRHIYRAGRKVEIEAGNYLFRQYEDEHSIFIVLLGRLRVFQENKGNSEVLGDIGPGETVGEVAFFTDQPRMASVIAVRNSILIEFDPVHYLELATSHPEFTRSLFKLVINRIQRNTWQSSQTAAPNNIAIICLEDCVGFKGLLSSLEAYFSSNNDPVNIIRQKSSTEQEPNALFNALDENEGLNMLVCDQTDPEWAKKCVIYADLLILFTKFDSDPAIRQIEKELRLYEQNVLQKKIYLALLHEADTPPPVQTARWLSERKTDLHIHLRNGHQKDIQRLGRILSNKAVGLVLGGGGAKGFAHIGVVRALQEAGIDIDFLGGTSAGALYGIGMAFADFDFDRIAKLNEEAVRRKLTTRDLTLPVFSFMSGKKFKAYLKEMYGPTEFEDIPINTYCVSTNLTVPGTDVHRRGLVWKKVTASMAIPGIFPPVIIDGCLHVDGGVMDNLPIEPMYDYPVGTIIAVSLNSMNIKKLTVSELPTPGAMLMDRLSRKKKYHLPGFASLLVNSLIINSKQKETANKEKVTHYLRLELKGVKLLEDKQWEEIAKKGYDQTKAYLSAMDM